MLALYFAYKFFDVLHFTPDLKKSSVDGFSAGLIDDDDIFKWEIVIYGPPDTI